jgi:hypothetical protein
MYTQMNCSSKTNKETMKVMIKGPIKALSKTFDIFFGFNIIERKAKLSFATKPKENNKNEQKKLHRIGSRNLLLADAFQRRLSNSTESF